MAAGQSPSLRPSRSWRAPTPWSPKSGILKQNWDARHASQCDLVWTNTWRPLCQNAWPLTRPRVRKIRCDETSPVCNNCTKSGRRCDGVAEPVNKDGGLTFTAPLTLTHFRPTQTGWLTQQEIAHLDLFRHELVYSIVGHVGTPSWKRLILQAVHEEVALCHAVVAFTALSTSGADFGDGGPGASTFAPSPTNTTSRENEFALRHYGKALEAMRHVFRHNDKRSINTALLCTLLCICFELRIKEPATALTHLEHGLQVVNSNLHTGTYPELSSEE